LGILILDLNLALCSIVLHMPLDRFRGDGVIRGTVVKEDIEGTSTIEHRFDHPWIRLTTTMAFGHYTVACVETIATVGLYTLSF
jgi:hypothetical protein